MHSCGTLLRSLVTILVAAALYVENSKLKLWSWLIAEPLCLTFATSSSTAPCEYVHIIFRTSLEYLVEYFCGSQPEADRVNNPWRR